MADNPPSPGPLVVKPNDLEWKNHPALPAGARFTVVLGDSSKPGVFVIRVHSPPGVRVMPHTHPEDRVYTVISGRFEIGFGNRFESGLLQAVPEGGMVFVPKRQAHFQFAEETGYVIQIHGIGPTSTDYLRAEDDPRRLPPERGKP